MMEPNPARVIFSQLTRVQLKLQSITTHILLFKDFNPTKPCQIYVSGISSIASAMQMKSYFHLTIWWVLTLTYLLIDKGDEAISFTLSCSSVRYNFAVSIKKFNKCNDVTAPTSLKGLTHSQNYLHSFSDSEAYHEQMGPIASSNESLDIALSIAHMTLFSDYWRNKISLKIGKNTELFVFALISRLKCWCLKKSPAGAY